MTVTVTTCLLYIGHVARARMLPDIHHECQQHCRHVRNVHVVVVSRHSAVTSE
jgi:hypothetical protein